MTPTHRPPNDDRRGSAALLVLVVLFVLGGLVAWFALSLGTAPAHTGGPLPGGSSPAPTTAHTPTVQAAPTAPTLAPEAGRTTEPGAPVRVGGNPDRFRGSGTLRGSVDTAVGLDMPATWTLVLEPSASLAGSGTPVERRVELTASETDFTVEDLPLGGYAVRAEAPGCNGRAVHLLLERTSASAYVMLQLSPAGFVEGRLLATDGDPLEAVDVWLFPGAPRAFGSYGADGRRTASNVEGMWRFDSVIDGPYTLIFGSPDRPLVEPAAISFQAPSLTWPSPEMPPLLDVPLLITDARGARVGGARIVGTSPMPFQTESQPNGEVLLRNLPRGLLTLTAEHEAYGEARHSVRLSDPDGDGTVDTIVVGLSEHP